MILTVLCHWLRNLEMENTAGGIGSTCLSKFSCFVTIRHCLACPAHPPFICFLVILFDFEWQAVVLFLLYLAFSGDIVMIGVYKGQAAWLDWQYMLTVMCGREEMLLLATNL